MSIERGKSGRSRGRNCAGDPDDGCDTGMNDG